MLFHCHTSGRPWVAKIKRSICKNGCLWTCWWYVFHFWPLRVCVDYYKEYFFHEWSSMINVQSWPRSFWPNPSTKWSVWWGFTVCLTWLTLFTFPSKSESMPGHQTKLHARLFIRDIPGCPVWSSSITSARPAAGTTIRFPHNRQPSSILSSFFQWINGLISSLLWQRFGQPCNTMLHTLDRNGSPLVHVLIWAAVTGEFWSASIRKMVSPRV